MALGDALKTARMRKKLTPSEVAAVTRMKVQTVNELEAEDFSKMAAPVYAKGFIRMYAEFVGLDSQELIQEYVERFVEGPKLTPEVDVTEPSLPNKAPAQPPPSAAAPESLVLESTPPPAEESPFDGEVDLFTEVEPATSERRGILMDDGYREVAPPLRQRAGSLAASTVDSARQAWDRAGASCRGACTGCVRFVVDRARRLASTVGARRKELTQIDFRNLSAKHMMALLGVLVLVLFVISSLSRCVRGQGERAIGPASAAPPVAADPDDIYLD
ncbi:MAG: helix-turn-helix domain-containing protein [Lentisphaerae bacterium]|nr:helix-turn-helix domain-containing protein [Lentisphaerota bacterium]